MVQSTFGAYRRLSDGNPRERARRSFLADLRAEGSSLNSEIVEQYLDGISAVITARHMGDEAPMTILAILGKTGKAPSR